jgi:hypothetical protein
MKCHPEDVFMAMGLAEAAPMTLLSAKGSISAR